MTEQPWYVCDWFQGFNDVEPECGIEFFFEPEPQTLEELRRKVLTLEDMER